MGDYWAHDDDVIIWDYGVCTPHPSGRRFIDRQLGPARGACHHKSKDPIKCAGCTGMRRPGMMQQCNGPGRTHMVCNPCHDKQKCFCYGHKKIDILLSFAGASVWPTDAIFEIALCYTARLKMRARYLQVQAIQEEWYHIQQRLLRSLIAVSGQTRRDAHVGEDGGKPGDGEEDD